MERLRNGRFRHSFPSVRSALSFQFLANGWRSASYDVIPFAIPSIAHMKVVATPPAYTGAPQVDQDNQGDLTVPEGTPIQWTIRVQDGQGVSLRLNDDLLDVRALAGNTCATEHLASTNASYWIKPLGAGGVADSIRHRIRVIRDGKPSIQVEEMQDSTSRKLRHFSGAAQDDYGFSRLDFVAIHRGQPTRPRGFGGRRPARRHANLRTGSVGSVLWIARVVLPHVGHDGPRLARRGCVGVLV